MNNGLGLIKKRFKHIFQEISKVDKSKTNQFCNDLNRFLDIQWSSDEKNLCNFIKNDVNLGKLTLNYQSNIT